MSRSPTPSRAATETPARLLGLDAEVGTVVPGRRADLLVTDADLVPRAVLRAGRWVDVPDHPAIPGAPTGSPYEKEAS